MTAAILAGLLSATTVLAVLLAMPLRQAERATLFARRETREAERKLAAYRADADTELDDLLRKQGGQE
jgi:hypothetical protein